MIKTLVTGGTGLVGSAIKNANIKLSTQDVDLRDWTSTLSLFGHLKPEKVIHCAAKVGGIGGNLIPNMNAITPPDTGIQPVQAFVVENDISNAQALQEELDIQATL